MEAGPYKQEEGKGQVNVKTDDDFFNTSANFMAPASANKSFEDRVKYSETPPLQSYGELAPLQPEKKARGRPPGPRGATGGPLEGHMGATGGLAPNPGPSTGPGEEAGGPEEEGPEAVGVEVGEGVVPMYLPPGPALVAPSPGKVSWATIIPLIGGSALGCSQVNDASSLLPITCCSFCPVSVLPVLSQFFLPDFPLSISPYLRPQVASPTTTSATRLLLTTNPT